MVTQYKSWAGIAESWPLEAIRKDSPDLPSLPMLFNRDNDGEMK